MLVLHDIKSMSVSASILFVNLIREYLTMSDLNQSTLNICVIGIWFSHILVPFFILILIT